MKLRFKIAAATAAVTAAALTAVFVSTTPSSALTRMPTVTTPTVGYTSDGVQISPVTAAQLAAQSVTAQTKVRDFCAQDTGGSGCVSAVPAAIQQVLITAPGDPNETVTNRLSYLAQWHLTGLGCTLGSAPPNASKFAAQWAAMTCTVNVAIEADTGLQYLTWVAGQ